MTSVRIIDGAEAGRLLSPLALVDNADEAFLAITTGDIVAPPRIFSHFSESGLFAVMPGSSRRQGVFGAKIVSLIPGNPDRGRPAIQGFVALFSSETGAPTALVEGAALTLLRTAAASAAATRRLARADARNLGVLGAGAQASAHLDALRAVARLDDVVIWARDRKKAEAFADLERKRTGLSVRWTADPREAAAAMIVCAVTGAKEPVIEGAWLSQGAHVNLVGAHSPTTREIDTAGMARGRLYVDSRAGALSEAGDLILPITEGALAADHVVGEMGELLNGVCEGRRDAQEITIFKSLGHVSQDLYAAAALVAAAEG